MANFLTEYPAAQHTVSLTDFVSLLRTYARSHTRSTAVHGSQPWVGENIEPDAGYWIARDIMYAGGRCVRLGILFPLPPQSALMVFIPEWRVLVMRLFCREFSLYKVAFFVVRQPHAQLRSTSANNVDTFYVFPSQGNPMRPSFANRMRACTCDAPFFWVAYMWVNENCGASPPFVACTIDDVSQGQQQAN